MFVPRMTPLSASIVLRLPIRPSELGSGESQQRLPSRPLGLSSIRVSKRGGTRRLGIVRAVSRPLERFSRDDDRLLRGDWIRTTPLEAETADRIFTGLSAGCSCCSPGERGGAHPAFHKNRVQSLPALSLPCLSESCSNAREQGPGETTSGDACSDVERLN